MASTPTSTRSRSSSRAAAIAEAALAAGMRRLLGEGYEKIRAGMTSFAELARVSG
jgi:type II secretory ATPase GspE/PulE/Tfp pilus assembly ATPase PilB-like protein